MPKSESEEDLSSEDSYSGNSSEYSISSDDFSDEDMQGLSEFNKYLMEMYGKPSVSFQKAQRRVPKKTSRPPPPPPPPAKKRKKSN